MSSIENPSAPPLNSALDSALDTENGMVENVVTSVAVEPVAVEIQPPTLSNKVYSGVGWTTFGSFLGQLLNFVRTLILARLLTTGDFGLMGMAFTLTSALGSLTNLNLNTSIVVAEFEDDDQMHRHLNTIWTANIARGLLVSLILLAAAGPTARFYGEARLLPMLIVLAWTPMLLGLNNIGLMLASRNVDLGLMVRLTLTGNILSLLIVVGLAFWTRNVWALVWGNLLGTAITVALSYSFHPYRPRLCFDRTEFASALNFGKWMFVVGLMQYITITADNILVGRLLGASVLGAYMVAYTIANLPQNVVTQILESVLLPSFAELGRNDHARLEKTLLRVFTISCAMLTLVIMPISLLAAPLIHVAFGSAKWEGAIAPLQVLVLVGLFRGLIQIIAPLMVGMKRPELEARSTMASAALFIALLYPLTRHLGALGAAWAGVFTYVFAFVLRISLARHLAPGTFVRFPLVMALCALAGGLGAGAGTLALRALQQLGWNSALLHLIVGALVAVSVTFIALCLSQPALKTEFAGLARGLKKRLGRA